MSRILHVLNGDDTLAGFTETGLEGDIMVWREVLSEGPLTENIASGTFWTSRKEWITQTFNDTEENYTHKVIDEIAKLNDGYDEINLWFEFDMHISRLTPNENGLNSVEQALLDIYQSGVTGKMELYQEFWTRLPIYGMGDKELDLYFNSLQKKQAIEIH